MTSARPSRRAAAILKPGGTLLATFPGLSQICPAITWRDDLVLGLHDAGGAPAVRGGVPAGAVRRSRHTATCSPPAPSSTGSPRTSSTAAELDHRDPSYEMLITARLVKAATAMIGFSIDCGAGRGAWSREALTPRVVHTPLPPHRRGPSRSLAAQRDAPPLRASTCDVLARRQARASRFAALLGALGRRRLRRRDVAVTFDDGYADNLRAARPLLARHDAPGHGLRHLRRARGTRELLVGRARAAAARRPGRSPSSLMLQVAGSRTAGTLGDDALGRRRPRRRRAWEPWGNRHPTGATPCTATFYDLLFPLSAAERVAALDALGAWAGTPATARASDRSLTEAELTELADDGLVDIGCHTLTHPLLSLLAPAAPAPGDRAGARPPRSAHRAAGADVRLSLRTP